MSTNVSIDAPGTCTRKQPVTAPTSKQQHWTNEAILAGFWQLRPDKLKIVGGPFSNEPWGIGLIKGDKVLCRKINSILEEAMRDGTWKEIFDATLGRAGIQVHPIPNIATCT